MMIHPDAMVAAALKIGREWGYEGYRVTEMIAIGTACLLEVCASDGARFYVGATRYGNTVHADDRSDAVALLVAQIEEDSKP